MRGDHFAINGASQFLVFVSYFDGVRRPATALTADLDWLKLKGVRGIRVWPNSGTPLMKDDGSLDPTVLSELNALVGAANTRDMVVDITANREGVCNPPSGCDFTVAEYQQALVALARDLIGKRNVLLDLQNEWNAHGGLVIPQILQIRAAVTAANPLLIVTVSSSGDDPSPAAMNAFDALSYHGPRDSAGKWASETDELVDDLQAQLALLPRRVAPVYLQEPNRFPIPEDGDPSKFDNNKEHYWTSVRNARASGAAAWTFHTGNCFDLSSLTLFSNKLFPDERLVLEQLTQKLTEPSTTWAYR